MQTLCGNRQYDVFEESKNASEAGKNRAKAGEGGKGQTEQDNWDHVINFGLKVFVLDADR